MGEQAIGGKHRVRQVVHFHMVDGQDNPLGAVQFHDAPVIPDIGDLCHVVTSRDSNGNYSSDGKPQRRWNGTVLKREFSYEVQGKSSATYRTVVYVDIYVGCTARAWAAWQGKRLEAGDETEGRE